ncbi:MAG TPA: Fic family protein [Longimicrobiaceae bacterium]|jgi:Fic family protein|nr:Fic family protein [Longimicrobiaceae bacterium]
MELRDALAEVDRLRAELDALRPLDAAQQKRVMDKFRLEWNYHSNAIEGNSLTFGETRAFLLHGLTAKGKPFKDYLDIQGHDRVIDVLLDVVHDREELTESMIREMHKVLLVEPYSMPAESPEGLPTSRRIEIGQYKTAANHVVTRTGQTHYFAEPVDTPARMANLIRWFRENRDNPDVHPVLLAALFHHQFVAIHPFDDGNGRLARILLNLILMRAGYPPVVFKLEKKAEYFLALEKADVGEEEDFVVFVAESLIDSLRMSLKAARGESIDELADFDKRLNLLTRTLQTRADPSLDVDDEWTKEMQLRVLPKILLVFRAVAERITHLNGIFASPPAAKITASSRDGAHSQTFDDPRLLSENVVRWAAERLLTALHMNHEGRLRKSVLASLSTRLRPDVFAPSVSVRFHPTSIAFRAKFPGLPPSIYPPMSYLEFSETNMSSEITKFLLADLVASVDKLASS